MSNIKHIHFITPTKLSLLDISSMGDSKKRDDPTTLGTFDSGLKYAIALLLRSDVNIDISVYGGKEERGDWEEPYTDYFTFGTNLEVCSSTKKEKELITIECETVFHGGEPISQHDMREPSGSDKYSVKTGFAKALGFNWDSWMAIRELWSNMLDEKGYVTEGDLEDTVEEGTVITLSFEEDNEFENIWQNKHLYINEKEPLYKISNSVEVLENEEGYLRIYKQNILVYNDENKQSRWAYNIQFGEIDERRILSDVYSVEGDIVNAIRNTSNTEFLREIIKPTFETEKQEFLTGRSTYFKASNLVHDIAIEVYEKYGQVDSYGWLIESIKKRKDCKIGGKKITTVEDSLWDYSKSVSIESSPQPFSEPSIIVEDVEYDTSFVAEIKRHYNFVLDVEVRKASLKGSKVVADKYEKCLIIDNDFSVENDMGELIVEYIDLTKEGNVIKNLSKYILELIKK